MQNRRVPKTRKDLFVERVQIGGMRDHFAIMHRNILAAIALEQFWLALLKDGLLFVDLGKRVAIVILHHGRIGGFFQRNTIPFGGLSESFARLVSSEIAVLGKAARVTAG